VGVEGRVVERGRVCRGISRKYKDSVLLMQTQLLWYCFGIE